jgi:hypothetical protein
VVVGAGIPKPCMTFDEASMPQYILTEVLKCGFERPTPIQSQGWPMALKGKVRSINVSMPVLIRRPFLTHFLFRTWLVFRLLDQERHFHFCFQL